MALSAPGRPKNLPQKLTKLTKEGPLRARFLAPQKHSTPSLSPVKSSGVGGIKVSLASPSRNDPALPKISEDVPKHGLCFHIFMETKPAGF
jgi:hypothetical protein